MSLLSKVRDAMTLEDIAKVEREIAEVVRDDPDNSEALDAAQVLGHKREVLEGQGDDDTRQGEDAQGVAAPEPSEQGEGQASPAGGPSFGRGPAGAP
jgi:hypothetical protein